MNWKELAERISAMTPQQKRQEVCLIQDLDGPAQCVRPLTVSFAVQDIWNGFGIGSELAFVAGTAFMEPMKR